MGETKGHVVLYRKYRSRGFDEIVGQEHIIKPLKNAVESGKIAHAYLFTGPRGTGKTSVARILANAINGYEYADQLPIDIIEIDGASNRRIDEVRELKERIFIAPAQAKYKVYIIDEVHMLTKEAFNALLKTLEEPPEHAVFILATTEVNKLPATIISRTQRYAFRLVPTNQVVAHLKYICEQESTKYEDEGLAQIAKMGQGSFRDSISLLDQVSSAGDITKETISASLGVSDESEILQLVSLLESATPKEITSALDALFASGASASEISKQIIDLIRQKDAVNSVWLQLVDSLVEVGGSMQPEVSLHVCLLRANLGLNPGAKLSTATAPPEKPKPTPPKMPPKPAENKEPKDEAVKPAAKEDTPATPSAHNASELIELDEKTWDEVLKIIKAKNNALYAVLRMSAPYLDNNVLVLQFRFEFHQKQVQSSKVIVISAVQEVIGNEIELVCEVNKDIVIKNSQTEADEQSTVTKEDVETVAVSNATQNAMEAFGGGEVLNI